MAERERAPFAACNLCGGREFTTIYRGCPDRRHWVSGSFDVVRCHGCGLVQTQPRLARESLAAFYPETYVSFAAPNRRAPGRAAACLKTLVRLPYLVRYGQSAATALAPTGRGRLLDIGCGTGTFLDQMARLGWEAWGIEPTGELARSVVERLGIPPTRIFAGEAEEAEFPPESFDLVTMWHVLEHLHDPQGVLSKAHNWLCAGGVLRISVPNIASFEARLFRRFWFGLDVPRHLYHFSPETARRLLEACGFRVEQAVPEFQASSLGGSLSHLVDGVLGRRREYRHSTVLYRAVLPVGSMLLALGNTAVLDITARKA